MKGALEVHNSLFFKQIKFDHLEKEMIGKNGISLNVCYFFIIEV